MTCYLSPMTTPKFCSNCGGALNEGARFCHACGAVVGSTAAPATGAAAAPTKMFWWPIVFSLAAVLILVGAQFGSLPKPDDSGQSMVLGDPNAGGGAGNSRAPDISSLTPQQAADRLFDKIMTLAGEGKKDSAAFFAPMAMGAIEAIGPLDNHRRYDIGLIALVSGDVKVAGAQADTILKARPTHLLGLILAAKTAEAKADNAAAASFRQRLVAAEPKERAAGLEEYVAHDRDITQNLEAARRK